MPSARLLKDEAAKCFKCFQERGECPRVRGGAPPALWGGRRMEQVIEALELCIRAGLPAMLWGPPGVGKSETVRTLARTKGWGLVVTTFADRNPVDVSGIPIPDPATGRTRYLPPDEYPDPARDGERGIWFLDEITNAPRDVQTTALRLFLERRLSNYQVPPGWHLVAAGNRVVDRAGSYQMISSLANRMVHIPVCCSLPPLELAAEGVAVDFESWLKWAYGRSIREEVIAFLGFRQELLWKPTGQVAYATPRTWEFTSRVLDAAEGRFVRLAVAGCVGDGPAGEFAEFIRVRKEMPDPDAILGGRDVAAPREPSVCYAVCTALVGRLIALKKKKRGEQLAAAISNLMRWLPRLQREHQIFCLKSAGAAGLMNEIAADPGFSAFARSQREVFMDVSP